MLLDLLWYLRMIYYYKFARKIALQCAGPRMEPCGASTPTKTKNLPPENVKAHVCSEQKLATLSYIVLRDKNTKCGQVSPILNHAAVIPLPGTTSCCGVLQNSTCRHRRKRRKPFTAPKRTGNESLKNLTSTWKTKQIHPFCVSRLSQWRLCWLAWRCCALDKEEK